MPLRTVFADPVTYVFNTITNTLHLLFVAGAIHTSFLHGGVDLLLSPLVGLKNLVGMALGLSRLCWNPHILAIMDTFHYEAVPFRT